MNDQLIRIAKRMLTTDLKNRLIADRGLIGLIGLTGFTGLTGLTRVSFLVYLYISVRMPQSFEYPIVP
jgi:hypothetical protein